MCVGAQDLKPMNQQPRSDSQEITLEWVITGEINLRWWLCRASCGCDDKCGAGEISSETYCNEDVDFCSKNNVMSTLRSQHVATVEIVGDGCQAMVKE